MSFKNRGLLIGAVAAGAFVLAVVIFCVLLFAGKDDADHAVETKPSDAVTVAVPETTASPEQNDQPEVAETTEPTEISTVETTVPVTQPEETEPPVVYVPDPPAPTSPPPEETYEQILPLKFPYTIPGTSLTIQRIGGYSGIFLEDGSDSEISNVTAMILVNNGDLDVELAEITLYCNGEQMTFKATALPAGCTIMVQELNAAPSVRNATYTECTANVATLDSFGLSEDKVEIVESEDGVLVVTNLTDETIPCVRVFYKFYMESQDVYVGGISYVAKVVELGANESQTIRPTHYLPGSSRIVMVRTYDTVE